MTEHSVSDNIGERLPNWDEQLIEVWQCQCKKEPTAAPCLRDVALLKVRYGLNAFGIVVLHGSHYWCRCSDLGFH